MSKIKQEIVTRDGQVIEMEFEKVAFVVHGNSMQTFTVPKNNFVKTKFGIFKWDENKAYFHDEYMVCLFNTKGVIASAQIMKTHTPTDLKGKTHD